MSLKLIVFHLYSNYRQSNGLKNFIINSFSTYYSLIKKIIIKINLKYRFVINAILKLIFKSLAWCLHEKILKKSLTTSDSFRFSTKTFMLQFSYMIYNVPVPLILFLNTKTNKMKYSIFYLKYITQLYDILDMCKKNKRKSTRRCRLKIYFSR